MIYCFALQITGISMENIDDPAWSLQLDPLYEAGCDDAMVSICDDDVFVNFEREAETFEEAVAEAKRNVEAAGMTVVRVVEE